MMLETPRRSGDFSNCRRITTSAGSRQAHPTSRPGPDRPLFLERPWRSRCGRRAEVETAFKAGTVDTGPASALQGTDLASSILHQLRQHLTAPGSSNTCECVADTQTGVVRRAVAPGGHGHVAFHTRVMDFVASLDLYRKVHKEAV